MSMRWKTTMLYGLKSDNEDAKDILHSISEGACEDESFIELISQMEDELGERFDILMEGNYAIGDFGEGYIGIKVETPISDFENEKNALEPYLEALQEKLRTSATPMVYAVERYI